MLKNAITTTDTFEIHLCDFLPLDFGFCFGFDLWRSFPDDEDDEPEVDDPLELELPESELDEEELGKRRERFFR